MRVVCFFPGMMGSILRTQDGRTVWPPTATEVLSGMDARKLQALLSEDDLTPIGAVEQVCLKGIYRNYLNNIESVGYSRDGGEKRLAVMDYDWRLDIVDEIAPGIADRLDVLVNKGAEEFHFTAHSMGGLVARVLVQDEQYADRSWRGKVRQLITMATPFMGAPLALARLMGLEDTLGIPAAKFAEFRTIPRLRGAYQLMPPRHIPLIWRVVNGQVHSVDLYENNGFGENNGFLRNSLDSVDKLHVILNSVWPDDIPAFQFAATGFETVTRLGFNLGVTRVKDDNSGDETVPLSSATSTTAPTMILPGDHLGVVNNRKLLRTVKALIGADQDAVIFAAEAGPDDDQDQTGGMQIMVPTEGVIVSEGALVPALIASEARRPNDVIVKVSLARIDPRTEKDLDDALGEYEITVGAGMDECRFRFPAPQKPGLYSVTLTENGTNLDSTSLIVRDRLQVEEE